MEMWRYGRMEMWRYGRVGEWEIWESGRRACASDRLPPGPNRTARQTNKTAGRPSHTAGRREETLQPGRCRSVSPLQVWRALQAGRCHVAAAASTRGAGSRSSASVSLSLCQSLPLPLCVSLSLTLYLYVSLCLCLSASLPLCLSLWRDSLCLGAAVVAGLVLRLCRLRAAAVGADRVDGGVAQVDLHRRSRRRNAGGGETPPLVKTPATLSRPHAQRPGPERLPARRHSGCDRNRCCGCRCCGCCR